MVAKKRRSVVLPGQNAFEAGGAGARQPIPAEGVSLEDCARRADRRARWCCAVDG